MKEKLMDKLGIAGLILFYIISLIVSFMPLLSLPIRGILFFVFAALMYFIPATSVIFWIWGLIYVLGGRQDAFAIIYYVCFAIVFMPVFLDASVRLYEKYCRQHQSEAPPVTQAPTTYTKGSPLVDQINKNLKANAEALWSQNTSHVDGGPSSMADLMRLSYTRLSNIAADSDYFEDRLLEEAIPFLFEVMITVSNTNQVNIDGDLDAIADFINEKGVPASVLEDRAALYNKILTGILAPRGEWFIGTRDYLNLENNSLPVKLWRTYGDLVINESCAEDYENAPTVFHDIAVRIKLAKIMSDIQAKVLNPMVRDIELMR